MLITKGAVDEQSYTCWDQHSPPPIQMNQIPSCRKGGVPAGTTQPWTFDHKERDYRIEAEGAAEDVLLSKTPGPGATDPDNDESQVRKRPLSLSFQGSLIVGTHYKLEAWMQHSN